MWMSPKGTAAERWPCIDAQSQARRRLLWFNFGDSFACSDKPPAPGKYVFTGGAHDAGRNQTKQRCRTACQTAEGQCEIGQEPSETDEGAS